MVGYTFGVGEVSSTDTVSVAPTLSNPVVLYVLTMVSTISGHESDETTLLILRDSREVILVIFLFSAIFDPDENDILLTCKSASKFW